ncbi:MAG: hypothetical protein CVT77_10530 [Alphaproteobacteria bacterium HGW-Alphaproteobacteria-16]|nr:MAG: hypothetical protein CVT77_10530 [Alphaproteobacteria bacterium HGW-Alphaproteobacteria-16]
MSMRLVPLAATALSIAAPARAQDSRLDSSTNYRMHALGIAHVPAPNLLIDLAYYHHRPLDPAFAGGINPADWLDRLRLNLMVSF